MLGLTGDKLKNFCKRFGYEYRHTQITTTIKIYESNATFAKGIGTIGTLGFSPRIVKDIKLVLDLDLKVIL